MATPTTTMRLTASDRRRLDALAAAGGTDRTAVVRRLIAEADETPAQDATSSTLSEHELLAVVVAATESNWRAATWLLERGWPERWAPRRTRPEPEPEPVPIADDPFAEVDELARRRRGRP